jgi:hypothetical protein
MTTRDGLDERRGRAVDGRHRAAGRQGSGAVVAADDVERQLDRGQSVAAVGPSGVVVHAERNRVHRHADPRVRNLDPADHAAQYLPVVAFLHPFEPRCSNACAFVLGERVEYGVQDHLLEFASRKARDAAGFLCTTLQHGLAGTSANRL